MNKYEKLVAVLDSSGIPFAYKVWTQPPTLPWGVYFMGSETKLFADGVPYYVVTSYVLELYTSKKDLETEGKLDDTLTEAGINYSKYESYIDSQELFLITYDCEV